MKKPLTIKLTATTQTTPASKLEDNNNMNTHNVYIDNGHVTVRQFANNNDLNVQALRNLVRHDKNIESSFIKNSTRHYDLKKLNEWLSNNKHKFEGDYVSSKSTTCDSQFYCGNCGRYKNKEDKLPSSPHCKSCTGKVTKPVIFSDIDLPVHVIHRDSRRGIDAIMEGRALEAALSEDWFLGGDEL